MVRAVEGGRAASIFNVLMIARAPLQLFQAVLTSGLPAPDRAAPQLGSELGEGFHHSVRMVLLGIAAFTALTAVVVMIAGRS